MTEGADGLVEDTRFNGPAQDGAEYTDEGIYTITVANEYTGQLTVKKIYVGTNNVLRAHMTTGLSIPEINNLVDQGASIADDGTIQLASVIPATPKPDDTTEPTTTPEKPSEPVVTPSENDEPTGRFPIFPVIGVFVVCAIIGIIILTKKKSKQDPVVVGNQENIEGGTEE